MNRFTEFIVDGYYGNNYIKTYEDKVPDSFMDDLLEDLSDDDFAHFSHVNVYFVDSGDTVSFYEHILDNQRLDHFMDAEINKILRKFNDTDKNPRIRERFYKNMINKIMSKLGIESSPGEFEEFLESKRRVKSARNI